MCDSNLGSYAYIEASSPRQPNEKAKLTSPAVSGRQCLKFSYHMYGSGMGTLYVYLTGPNKKVFEKNGNQGNRWISQEVQLDSRSRYHVSAQLQTRDAHTIPTFFFSLYQHFPYIFRSCFTTGFGFGENISCCNLFVTISPFVYGCTRLRRCCSMSFGRKRIVITVSGSILISDSLNYTHFVQEHCGFP